MLLVEEDRPSREARSWRRIERVATVSLVLFALWIVVTLFNDANGQAASLPVRSTVLSGQELSRVEALRGGSRRESTTDRLYRDVDEHLVQIEPTAGLAPPYTLEIQRAHAPLTRAWQVQRDGATIVALAPLATVPSARGTIVPLPLAVGERPEVLIAAENLGRLKPRVNGWQTIQVEQVEGYQRYMAGATLGLFLFLATFGALIALMGGERIFLFFAAWSLTSLRSVAVNEGWATSWLFDLLPPSLVPTLQGATLALHILFSLLLAGAILKTRLSDHAASDRAWRLLCAAMVGLTLLSPLAYTRFYYPALWLLAGLSMAYILSTLWLAQRRQANAVHRWYSVFWLVTLACQGGEIAYAAGLLASPLPLLSTRSGALLGGLTMAITMAQYVFRGQQERYRARRAELGALRQLATTYESTPIGLFRLDESGAVLMYNPTFAALFSLKPWRPANLAMPIRDILGDQAMERIRHAMDSGTSSEIHLRVVQGRRQDRYFSLTAHRTSEGIEGSISDTTKRVVAERRLEHLIDHDPLTGALNQRGLDAALKAAIDSVAAGGNAAFVDLHVDRFKMINDLYGLAMGDALLGAVHDRLRAGFGASLSMARIGDSFKLLMPDSDGAAALELSERVLVSIASTPFVIDDKYLNLTASAGLVTISAAMNCRDVMTTASNASADARRAGRNRVVQAQQADLSLKEFFEDLAVQATLKDRLESDRFFLEFQPIVNLRNPNQSLSLEALVRMRDERGMVISPARFIPAAERNGQISMIDRWVLRTTLAWFDDHPREAAAIDFVTINLSGASLNDARFVDDAFRLIADVPKLGRKLCFEITETVALADPRATRLFADRVHSMDGTIALDDFGAGYTSFTYLKELDADIIKIDGSFVRDLHDNPQNLAITRAIAALAHQLDKRCIAEWVEVPDTVKALLDLGVDFAQGFVLCPPRAPETFIGVRNAGELIQHDAVRQLLHCEGQPISIGSAATTRPRPAVI